MKIEFSIEDIGTTGNIRLEMKPKFHVLQRMAQAKNPSPSLSYAGLMLKKFYEAIPSENMVKNVGDNLNDTFEDARQKQTRQANISDAILNGSKRTQSGIYLP